MTSRIIDELLKVNREMSVDEFCQSLGRFISVQSAVRACKSRVQLGRVSSNVSLSDRVVLGKRRLMQSMLGTLYRDKILCRVSIGVYKLHPDFDK